MYVYATEPYKTEDNLCSASCDMEHYKAEDSVCFLLCGIERCKAKSWCGVNVVVIHSWCSHRPISWPSQLFYHSRNNFSPWGRLLCTLLLIVL